MRFSTIDDAVDELDRLFGDAAVPRETLREAIRDAMREAEIVRYEDIREADLQCAYELATWIASRDE